MASSSSPDKLKLVLAYLLCALVWGTTWFAIRVCIAPGGYPTVFAAAARFVIAIAILLPLCFLRNKRSDWPRGRTLVWLLLAGVLNAVGYLLVYLGEERVSGGVAAVVVGTEPLVVAAFATATRMERITRSDLLGALISLGGVALLFRDRLQVSAEQAVGVMLMLFAVVVSTMYSMIMKRHGASLPALVATTIFLVATAGTLVLAALVTGSVPPWPLPGKATLALFYLAVFGSVIAFLSYFWMLQRVRVVTANSLVVVFPLVALIVDALWESTKLGAGAYLAAALTLAGLAVSTLGRVRQGKQEERARRAEQAQPPEQRAEQNSE